jgi:pimeloyl-ACP methyl ester carboxylesterase
MFLVSFLAAMHASAAAPPEAPVAAPAPTPAAYVKPAPPGELVDIGDRRLHLECKGDAQGPIVLFEAGLSQYTAHSTYGKAQDAIASFARVCTYDRAGLGWSDPIAGARTHDDTVDDLRKLVAAARLDRPLVLVGHSMGGLIARLYAKKYPKDIAAIVLVDATPEAYLYGPGAADARKAIIAKIDEGLKAALSEDAPVVPMPAGTPAEVMMAFTPSILRTLKQEYEAIDRVPEALRGGTGYGMLGDKPLAVIRRGRESNPPSETDLEWRGLQQSLTKLSTRSTLIVAANAGHVIPYDDPQIVADTVRQILNKLAKR